MPFTLVDKNVLPPRRWGLEAFADAGKTTFLMQMRGGILVVDADHRVEELAYMSEANIYSISDRAEDHVTPSKIAQILDKQMPSANQVSTIGVDSVTSIISLTISQAQAKRDAGELKPQQVMMQKASAMRLLRLSVNKWNRDTLWIWHLQEGRDKQGNPQVTRTLPPAEHKRLRSVLNAELRIVRDDMDRRGIHVNWSRGGRSGFTVWDDSGFWDSMPEIIELAMFKRFTGPDDAKAWAVSEYKMDAESVEAEYQRVREERKPESAGAMWMHWVLYVLGCEYSV